MSQVKSPLDNFFQEFISVEGVSPRFTSLHILTFVSGFIFYSLCYLVIVPAISRLVSASYRQLEKTASQTSDPKTDEARKKAIYDVADWKSRGVSFIHAFFALAAALYTVFYHGSYSYNLLSVDEFMDYTLMNSMSYFAYDLIYVLNYTPSDWVVMTHHIIGLSCWSTSVGYNMAKFVLMQFLLTEFSVLFVNVRMFLILTGRKTGTVFKFNSFMMWLSFLMARIPPVFLVPLHIYMYFHQYAVLPRFILVESLICTVLITTLNTLWFRKITLSTYKTIFGGSTTPTRQKQQ